MEIKFSDLNFIYLNLDHDREKSSRLQTMLDLLDVPSGQVHRISASYNSNSYLGILNSQIKALEFGLELNVPFVVLEDDVDLNSFKEKLIFPDEVECLYLGLSSWGLDTTSPSLASLNSPVTYPIPEYPELCRIKKMFSAHSILYPDVKFVKILIQNLKLNEKGIHLDLNLGKINLNYLGSKILPCDIIMSLMQEKYYVAALRNPIFFQGGEHEYCTKIKF
jgi:hypothetical protein